MSHATKKTRASARVRRRRRVRAKVRGAAARPRLSVFRSNRGIGAQLIDDDSGHTVAAVNWTESDLKGMSPMDQAKRAGELLAERAKDGRRRVLHLRPRRLPLPRPREGPGRRGPRVGSDASRRSLR